MKSIIAGFDFAICMNNVERAKECNMNKLVIAYLFIIIYCLLCYCLLDRSKPSEERWLISSLRK